jgi:hypothetical protein
MNTKAQPDNRLFKKMMIAVLLIIAAIFYTIFRLEASGKLVWQDNLIISILSVSGIYLFAKVTHKDRYRLDKG